MARRKFVTPKKEINLINSKYKNNQLCQFILWGQGSLRQWGNKQICISQQMAGRRPLWTQFMKIVSQFKIQFRKLSRLTFHCVLQMWLVQQKVGWVQRDWGACAKNISTMWPNIYWDSICIQLHQALVYLHFVLLVILVWKNRGTQCKWTWGMKVEGHWAKIASLYKCKMSIDLGRTLS